MTLSVQNPADMVNLALVRIGHEQTIGNLYDGSREALLAINIYSQTRDEMLRNGDWGFAERNVSMTLLKQAPAGGYVPPLQWSSTYPPLPWIYEYQYPNDCLEVRAVRPQAIFIPEFDPQPHVFAVENDNALFPPQKVILCNVPSAILVYTGRITDPQTWEPAFIEAFAAALGERLAPALSDLNAAKLEAADEIEEDQEAKARVG